jgi:hypothetical protein
MIRGCVQMNCESLKIVFLGVLRVEVPSLCDMIEISIGRKDLPQGISRSSEGSEEGSKHSQIDRKH